MNHDQT
jgi:hypothetical protein